MFRDGQWLALSSIPFLAIKAPLALATVVAPVATWWAIGTFDFLVSYELYELFYTLAVPFLTGSLLVAVLALDAAIDVARLTRTDATLDTTDSFGHWLFRIAESVLLVVTVAVAVLFGITMTGDVPPPVGIGAVTFLGGALSLLCVTALLHAVYEFAWRRVPRRWLPV